MKNIFILSLLVLIGGHAASAQTSEPTVTGLYQGTSFSIKVSPDLRPHHARKNQIYLTAVLTDREGGKAPIPFENAKFNTSSKEFHADLAVPKDTPLTESGEKSDCGCSLSDFLQIDGKIVGNDFVGTLTENGNEVEGIHFSLIRSMTP
jgi:hypothetical protein